MKTKKIAFYHCHTPLHIGSGTTLDVIDLPIQRETHTDFPVMPSTSIKGVIRAEYGLEKVFKDIENFKEEPKEECKENSNKNCYELDDEECKFFCLFGYGDREGDIIFTDGKILLFPVKSVKGVFAWITCPLVLERFERDTEINLNLSDEIKKLDDNQAIAGKDIKIDNYLVLEELSFDASNSKNSILETIHNLLSKNLKEEIPKEKIAIVSNDRFRYFVKNHTEVNARIRIDQATGTAGSGALWYEELIPAETVFYNLILSRTDNERNLNSISGFINEKKIFQFGGDETLGRGFTKVYIKGSEGNKSSN